MTCHISVFLFLICLSSPVLPPVSFFATLNQSHPRSLIFTWPLQNEKHGACSPTATTQAKLPAACSPISVDIHSPENEETHRAGPPDHHALHTFSYKRSSAYFCKLPPCHDNTNFLACQVDTITQKEKEESSTFPRITEI